jgi:uncharacterized FlaG/YvyC family protein
MGTVFAISFARYHSLRTDPSFPGKKGRVSAERPAELNFSLAGPISEARTRPAALAAVASSWGVAEELSMDLNPVNRIVQTVPTSSAATLRSDQAAQLRELVQAVKALNQTEMFGQENELQFQRDPATRRMVIRVVNRKTKEVVAQAPPQYVLALAQDLKKT